MKRWSAMAKHLQELKDIVMAVKEGGPNPDQFAIKSRYPEFKAANMQ
jgi:hypothetical protein